MIWCFVLDVKSYLHGWSTGAAEVAGRFCKIIWSLAPGMKSYLHGWSTDAGEVAGRYFIITWSFVLR